MIASNIPNLLFSYLFFLLILPHLYINRFVLNGDKKNPDMPPRRVIWERYATFYKYFWFYPHRSRDSVSPVCGISPLKFWVLPLFEFCHNLSFVSQLEFWSRLVIRPSLYLRSIFYIYSAQAFLWNLCKGQLWNLCEIEFWSLTTFFDRKTHSNFHTN